MQPAARLGDMHVCPMFDGPKPHVGGPCIGVAYNVLIGNLPAAKMGDTAICVGPPDKIVGGSPTVLINGKPAARMGDMTVHGGIITLGCFTVLIGGVSVGGLGGAMGAAKGLFGGIMDKLKQIDPMEALHTTLDVVGLIPGLGEIADGINAVLYLAEGDYTNAALSAAAMIPIGGQAATAAKLGLKGADAAKTIVKNADEVADLAKVASKNADEALDFSKSSYKNLGTQKPCFLKGTMVHTKKGLREINNIQVGDIINTYDFQNKRSIFGEVTDIFKNWTNKIYEISIQNEVIKTTGRHLFWIEEEQKWIPAKELKHGMKLKNPSGELLGIEKIDRYEEVHDTYNIEVDLCHNYFITSIGFLVHNGSKPSLFESTEKKPTKIYEVYDPQTGEVKYVGQTTQASVDDRFDQHLNEGQKKGNHKSNWDQYEVRQVDEGNWTPYEAHVNEQHHIDKNGGKENLQNKKNAITEKKFDEYKDPKYGHNPC